MLKDSPSFMFKVIPSFAFLGQLPKLLACKTRDSSILSLLSRTHPGFQPSGSVSMPASAASSHQQNRSPLLGWQMLCLLFPCKATTGSLFFCLTGEPTAPVNSQPYLPGWEHTWSDKKEKRWQACQKLKELARRYREESGVCRIYLGLDF